MDISLQFNLYFIWKMLKDLQIMMFIHAFHHYIYVRCVYLCHFIDLLIHLLLSWRNISFEFNWLDYLLDRLSMQVLEDEYKKYLSSAHIALDRRPPSAGVIEKDIAEAERYWSKLHRQITDYRHKVEVIFNIHKRFKTVCPMPCL